MKKITTIFVALLLLSFTGKAQTFTDQITGTGLERTDKIGEIRELFDYNNDGFEDIIYSTKNSFALLYKNNGNGTFTDASSSADFPVFKSSGTSLSCFDIDNNGFNDLVYYFSNGGTNVNDTLRIFMNYNGVFSEKTAEFGISNPVLHGTNHWNSNIIPFDFDRDGDLDILFASTNKTASNACNNSKVSVLVNKMNETSPSFNTVIDLITYPVNILAASLGVTDYNNDQLADFVVIEQSGAKGAFDCYRADPFELYKNNGNSTFTKVNGTNLADAALHNFITVWDYNNDGFLDFINGTSDCCGTRLNIIWKNNGNDTFNDMRSTYNLHPVSDYYGRLSAVDYNNDGNTDISTTNLAGFWSDTRHQLWENSGVGFVNKASINSLQIGYNGGFKGIGSYSEWFDYDNDGDLDFYTYHWNDGGNHIQSLMNNPNSSANKYLRIKLVGTTSPKDGIGSRVVLKSGNQKLTQYNNGTIGNNLSTIFHFGLGQNKKADSLFVYWSSGNITKMANVTANQILTITESIPFVPTSANPITPDENTVILDHFDLATSGEIVGSTSYVPSLKGLTKAVEFSATDNYLVYNKSVNLESAGTIEMWIKPNSFPNMLLNINWNHAYSSPAAGHVFHLQLDSVGKVVMTCWGWSVSNAFSSKSSVQLNEWTHIAVSWGDSTKIYINGKVDMVSAVHFRPAITESQAYFY
ncbi:MAG: FG-GAP-like repeat-containing protein, partial [Paludibacter sp.]